MKHRKPISETQVYRYSVNKRFVKKSNQVTYDFEAAVFMIRSSLRTLKNLFPVSKTFSEKLKNLVNTI